MVWRRDLFRTFFFSPQRLSDDAFSVDLLVTVNEAFLPTGGTQVFVKELKVSLGCSSLQFIFSLP